MYQKHQGIGITNPSLLIYKQYETQILSTRSNLFSSLSFRSKEIGTAAQKILERKYASSVGMGSPHLFEVFPWLLKDLTDLDSVKAQEISMNWLALYLYVSFLDDHLDLKTKIEPDEFIAASILAQTSLINLFKIVDNTKYEDLFKECLVSSAIYEFQDVRQQALVYKNCFTKSESASGKNAILLACAGAVAASTKKESDFIIDITRELLLSVQLLDDLTDIDEDLRLGNITIPLNDLGLDLEDRNWSRVEIISSLLQSNTLYKVLAQIESSLSNVVSLIHSSGTLVQQVNAALEYFYLLLAKVNHLKSYTVNLSSSFRGLSPSDKDKAIIDLETKLSEIYCHT